MVTQPPAVAAEPAEAAAGPGQQLEANAGNAKDASQTPATGESQPSQPMETEKQTNPAPASAPAPAAAAGAALPQRTPVPARDRYNQQSLGPSLNAMVKNARVLLVGAGGIGCELLKNLVLTGFSEIHVVDLDTIDLSNLNRQFLFRHEHIKKSKALVATEAAGRFNPNVKIVPHHGNIKDAEFNVPWFRDFKIVFNALDNLDARRHVNRMCLAADVPLVESGTTGFNGQAQVIKKGVTACYDCTPKETPKSFPVCTIRSTPSQPIHCIVWAKSYLLNEIFGTSEDESAFDHSEDAENAHEIEELKKESEALKKIRQAVGTDDFPQMLFDKVFKDDIDRLRSVEDLWKSRRKPDPLTYENVLAQSAEALASKDQILTEDQRIWSLEENLAVFKDSLDRLSKRMRVLKKINDPSAAEPTIPFDKDDQDTLDFVAASANIRSHIFGIDGKPRFDIKQMAGNIIPAIATTNAIVAGVCVLEAFKVLRGDYSQAKEVFLTPFAAARLLASDRCREPNPDCPVCGVFYLSVKADLSRATLRDVVEDLIKEQLGFGDKEFDVTNDVGIMYDPDETDNLPKKLSDLGVKDGSFLTVTDETDDEPLRNVVIHIEACTTSEGDKPIQATFTERPAIPHRPKKAANGTSETTQNGTNAEHPAPEAEAEPKGVKRQHSGEDSQPAKKTKLDGADVVDVDGGGGAIVIDDD